MVTEGLASGQWKCRCRGVAEGVAEGLAEGSIGVTEGVT